MILTEQGNIAWKEVKSTSYIINMYIIITYDAQMWHENERETPWIWQGQAFIHKNEEINTMWHRCSTYYIVYGHHSCLRPRYDIWSQSMWKLYKIFQYIYIYIYWILLHLYYIWVIIYDANIPHNRRCIHVILYWFLHLYVWMRVLAISAVSLSYSCCIWAS